MKINPHFYSHRIVKINGGKAPLTYQSFQTAASRLGAPEMAVTSPTLQDLHGTSDFYKLYVFKLMKH